MREIKVENAPKPVGPYSQAVEAGGFVFVSGQIPIRDGEVFRGDFKEQVSIVLENVEKILEGAGSSMNRVVKVTVYLRDLSKFSEFNEVYSGFFKKPYPARVVVEVSRLPKDVDVEMDVIALSGEDL